MKTIYQILGISVYAYDVVAETEKSYVVTFADGGGDYEHCVRKADENEKWFTSKEVAEARAKQIYELQQQLKELAS